MIHVVLIFVLLSGGCFCYIEKQVSWQRAYKKGDWWESAVFYQIYPRSFMDFNNDGIGDLQGIASKLGYLKETGVTAIWLSPIFESPQVDQGYDISDYKKIDPDYGTLDDMRKLIKEAHQNKLRIILDFVPNHTSDRHQWFINSVNKVKGYEDYYVWSDGRKFDNGSVGPPNNWISVFKGPAWTWNEKRGQYFLHQFAPEQPDLNFRNKLVVEAMDDVLLYWLDLGVDGFRIDAVPYLFEDMELMDEPVVGSKGYDLNDYSSLQHIYTFDQNETFNLIYKWRTFLDNYTTTHGGDTRIIMTECYSPLENIIRYYGTNDGKQLGAHFSFNFDFISKLSKINVLDGVFQVVSDWFEKLPEYYNFNWVLGNHDNPRVVTRLGHEVSAGLHALASLLPGIQVIYNGEEIGMENGEVACEEGKDPMAIKNCDTFDKISRDFERTPYQWDNSVNAGFNDGTKPWLPVSKKANTTNLKNQMEGSDKSYYKIYKEMLQIRNLQDFEENSRVILRVINETILELHSGGFIFLWNLGNHTEKFQIEEANYMLISSNLISSKSKGDPIDYKNVILKPLETIVVTTMLANNETRDSYKCSSPKLYGPNELLMTFIVLYVLKKLFYQ